MSGGHWGDWLPKQILPVPIGITKVAFTGAGSHVPLDPEGTIEDAIAELRADTLPSLGVIGSPPWSSPTTTLVVSASVDSYDASHSYGIAGTEQLIALYDATDTINHYCQSNIYADDSSTQWEESNATFLGWGTALNTAYGPAWTNRGAFTFDLSNSHTTGPAQLTDWPGPILRYLPYADYGGLENQQDGVFNHSWVPRTAGADLRPQPTADQPGILRWSSVVLDLSPLALEPKFLLLLEPGVPDFTYPPSATWSLSVGMQAVSSSLYAIFSLPRHRNWIGPPNSQPASSSKIYRLAAVRSANDETLAAVLNDITYAAPDGSALDFWRDVPADAGVHAALAWLNINFTGVADPHRRNVVYNRPSNSDATS